MKKPKTPVPTNPSVVIMTGRGELVDLMNLQPEQIDLIWVWNKLAKEQRFRAAAPYHVLNSVLAHSLRVHHLVRMELVAEPEMLEGKKRSILIAALLHDVAEAWTGDIIQPIKALLGGALAPLEDAIVKAILPCLNVPGDRQVIVHDMVHSVFVKTADRRVACWERDNYGLLPGIRYDGPRWGGDDYRGARDQEFFRETMHEIDLKLQRAISPKERSVPAMPVGTDEHTFQLMALENYFRNTLAYELEILQAC